jgi:hypothetical protein
VKNRKKQGMMVPENFLGDRVSPWIHQWKRDWQIKVAEGTISGSFFF